MLTNGEITLKVSYFFNSLLMHLRAEKRVLEIIRQIRPMLRNSPIGGAKSPDVGPFRSLGSLDGKLPVVPDHGSQIVVIHFPGLRHQLT